MMKQFKETNNFHFAKKTRSTFKVIGNIYIYINKIIYILFNI